MICTIRDNIDYIGHFHTAGNPGRNELDENQELYYPALCRAIAKGRELLPDAAVVVGQEQTYRVCDV